MRTRQVCRLVFVVVAAVAAAACGAERGERAAGPEPESESESQAESGLHGHSPPLVFAPCADDATLQCGTLEVPADYDHPRGPRLKLAVIRAPATGPGARIGALFVNAGGPGGAGVDFVLFGKARLAPYRQRFDVVSFDPRGVGRSEPLVQCEFEPPPEPAPGDPASRAQYLDEHARRFTQACLAQTGPVVTKLGTNNVARDLDRLRAALGEQTLSYHGVSYGSELGAVYASLFPKRVRAMVIDGGVPPTFSDYTIEAFIDEAAAHELALARLDEQCRRSPACPLQGTSLTAGLAQVLSALRTNPVTTPDGRVLDEDDAMLFAVVMLYNEQVRAGRLPGFVAAALANNYAPWFQFAGAAEPGLSQDLRVYAAVFCSDFGARRPAADFVPQLAAAEALYPTLGRRAELEVLLRTCHEWPAADPPIFRDVSRKLDHPILMIGNDFDAATPLEWTRQLARALGMEDSVLRYRGGGHTATRLVFRGVPCIDAIADKYLVDLELPPPGTSCPALAIAFPPVP